VKQHLLYPSQTLQQSTAWTWGTVALILTGIFATLGGLVTDGVLDLHFLTLSGLEVEPSSRWLQNWAQGLTNLAWAVACLWVAAKVMGRSVNASELIAYQLMARWPLALATAYLALPFVGDRVLALTFEMVNALPAGPDEVMAPARYMLPALELTAWSIPLLLCTAWMIWLMFESYRQLTQTTLGQAVPSFLIAILIAEISSKLTIW